MSETLKMLFDRKQLTSRRSKSIEPPDGMIIRYTCDGKVIGQMMFHYRPETYVDWFRSMINEMDPGKSSSMKKNKVKVREKRTPAHASQSHRPRSRKRKSLRRR